MPVSVHQISGKSEVAPCGLFIIFHKFVVFSSLSIGYFSYFPFFPYFPFEILLTLHGLKTLKVILDAIF